MHRKKREIVRNFWLKNTCFSMLCKTNKVYPDKDNTNNSCCSQFHFYAICKHNK